MQLLLLQLLPPLWLLEGSPAACAKLLAMMALRATVASASGSAMMCAMLGLAASLGSACFVLLLRRAMGGLRRLQCVSCAKLSSQAATALLEALGCLAALAERVL